MQPYLTFDCYDTLVQYSASKKACIEALVNRQNSSVNASAVVGRQREIERKLQLGPFVKFSRILCQSLKQAFQEYGLNYDSSLGALLQNSVRFAPCFAETREVLSYLAGKFRLVVISNSEPEVIKDNIAVIGVPFYRVITAADAKSYKPSLDIFRFSLKQLNCNSSELIHIAAGFYHDITPCAELGWQRIWINRDQIRGDKSLQPYTEFLSLRGLKRHFVKQKK